MANIHQRVLFLISGCLLITLPLDVDGRGEDMCLQPLAPNCTSCVDPGLDLSTDCTTCQQGPIECTTGEQDCGVGHFTFSALFHSYSNPTAMCGECGDNGQTVTCLEANPNPSTTCRFRFIYCLQPFGSPAQDVFFQVPQPPEDLTEEGRTHTFEEGFIVREGTNIPNFWNRSNPFTRELQTWPGKVQLYIIVYHILGITDIYVVVDRVPIDLTLGISSDFTERRTYSGIHNISQFDISFRLSGQCAEGYTGPWCNVLCSELEGLYTCVSEGNRVCENPDANQQNNCDRTTVSTGSTGSSTTGAIIGGVVGGIVGVVALLSLLIGVLLMHVCRKKSKQVSQVTSSSGAAEEDIKLEANVVYGVAAGEKMEMTQNQLYGVRSTGDNITMEANVVYGVANDGPGHTPPPTVEDAYDYVQ